MGSQFAPVAPIQVLEAMYEESPHTFGEYHLLLAHHTAEHYVRFARLFKRIEEDNIIEPLVIMDNSVVECGGFVDFDLMVKATECIVDSCSTADVIPVLPDVMGDGMQTRVVVETAYDHWCENMPGDCFMAVTQGKDWDDFEKSLDEFTSDRYPEIRYLGIPRVLVGSIGSRKDATRLAVAKRRVDQKIHLLGYSDDMWDDQLCSHISGVGGIDSAVPLRYPDTFHFAVDAGPRPKDWMETAEWNNLMRVNLHAVREAHNAMTRA